ncbi:thermonuclease family protein [Mesorhizobium sp. SP-1A]|uniref:thermonuclease family protein n=1 Tax=Mesorhizobium sp. SP-1A TaxID=3077840 RepID=UPI0028F6C30B|nr:thermonuclease family protein [Mesorhizobium sp. SP-1A]
MSIVLATVCIAANMFTCQPTHVRVIDGDTIQIRSEKFRFDGIDAPELKGACEDEIAVANLARDRVVELFAGGHVVIERTGRDKYRRTLAQISVDGKDIGKILMEEGLARRWEKKWKPGLDDVWCSGAQGR